MGSGHTHFGWKWLLSTGFVLMTGCGTFRLSGDVDGSAIGSEQTTVPVVRLTADNVSPGLAETVSLRCQLTSGSTNGLTYSFTPRNNLSSVDSSTGLATLIVSEADLGTAVSFSCRASNDAGTGPRSNVVTIIPSG